MTGEWKEKSLLKLAIVYKESWKVGDEKCPYIGLEHIEEGKLRLNGIGHSDIVTSNKYRFRENNFLFGKLRPYFRKVVLPRFSGICSTDIWVIGARNGTDLTFLFYLFANPEFINLAYSSSSGTKMPRADWSFMKNTKWLVPSDIEEQRAIASVLSSLDDKIDLLHRQNKTLEAMAETLFRQWFVEEADEEWEEKSLSSIADFLNGLACQKYPPLNEINKLPVLKIKELRNGISQDSDYATTKVKPEYLVENGDVIFSWSASLMVKIWDGEKCILNQHLFKVTSEDYPKWFYYQWCKYHLEEFVSISLSHATTMGHIKRGDLDVAMVLVPSNNELKEMTKSMAPLMEKLIINNKQICTLEKMRDMLLPKLMSGEVRVECEDVG
ncbi:MAG: restriction endonuclease subunit S [Methanomethylovorans sp.]|uniref:restriction endonuclease subunit S n=1 Tax=Methanomethylovorans sp. TaxID=2758717 RepID=UPI000A405B2A